MKKWKRPIGKEVGTAEKRMERRMKRWRARSILKRLRLGWSERRLTKKRMKSEAARMPELERREVK